MKAGPTIRISDDTETITLPSNRQDLEAAARSLASWSIVPNRRDQFDKEKIDMIRAEAAAIGGQGSYKVVEASLWKEEVEQGREDYWAAKARSSVNVEE